MSDTIEEFANDDLEDENEDISLFEWSKQINYCLTKNRFNTDKITINEALSYIEMMQEEAEKAQQREKPIED